MKPIWTRAALSAVWTAIALYAHHLRAPLVLLIVMVTLDYVTGMICATVTRRLSSERGWLGILKKVCYFAVVCVSIGMDRLFSLIAETVGLSYAPGLPISVFVTSWLVINEAISILENLALIGVPVPAFLKRLIRRLKVSVEQEAAGSEDEADTPDDPDGSA